MSEETIEEVVKPDRIGTMDPGVINWRAPTPEAKRTMMRVKQIRDWIESMNRFVHEEEIIRYCMSHWNIQRQAARLYLGKVVEDFKRKNVPVLEGREWMNKPQFGAYISIAEQARVQQNAEPWKEYREENK